MEVLKDKIISVYSKLDDACEEKGLELASLKLKVNNFIDSFPSHLLGEYQELLITNSKDNYLCEPFDGSTLKVEALISEGILFELIPDWYYLTWNNKIMDQNDYSEITATAGSKEITVIDILGRRGTFTITSTGHQMPDWVQATCLLEGQAERSCSNTSVNCTHKETRAEQPALEHDYGAWVITQEPTCAVAGSQKRTCNRINANTDLPCNETGYEETKNIDKLPHTIGNWIAGMVSDASSVPNSGAINVPHLTITKSCSECNSEIVSKTGNYLEQFITEYNPQEEIVPIKFASDAGFTKPGFHANLTNIIATAARKVALDFSKSTDDLTILIGTHPYSSTARTYITSIVMPTGWTIGYTFYADAFKGDSDSALAEITIPGNNITSIGNGAFSGNPNLIKVTINRAVPPTLGTNVFFGTHENLKIYVPNASLSLYKNAQGWNVYADRIVAIDIN